MNEDLKEIYNNISPLECLYPMAWYYHRVYSSIRHLTGDNGYDFYNFSFEQVRELRSYINSDLENFSTEFYLQHIEWANSCRQEHSSKAHESKAIRNPAIHPCQMRSGFKSVVDGGEYTYEEFFGRTLSIFVAIHSHLVSINRGLGDLYYYVTELPFSAFTPDGKSEIRHLTTELNRIMRGLLVATHLQPQQDWQRDLVGYLLTCRADCLRFLKTIPLYYQNHRMRIVVFPVDSISPENNPHLNDMAHPLPLACLPWSAGVYLDFLTAYDTIAQHVLATLHWAIRLYSLWYFVPRRYLRHISPMTTIE